MLPSAVWKTGRQTQPRHSTTFSGFLETALNKKSWPVPMLWADVSAWGDPRPRRSAPELFRMQWMLWLQCFLPGLFAHPWQLLPKPWSVEQSLHSQRGALVSCSLSPVAAEREMGSLRPVVLPADKWFVPRGWFISHGAAPLRNVLAWPSEGRDNLYPLYHCSLAVEESNTKIYFLEYFLTCSPSHPQRVGINQYCSTWACFCMRFLYSQSSVPLLHNDPNVFSSDRNTKFCSWCYSCCLYGEFLNEKLSRELGADQILPPVCVPEESISPLLYLAVCTQETHK